MAANVHYNLKNLGIEADFITNEEDIVKQRYIDKRSGQHMLRVDNDIEICQWSGRLPENLSDYDAVIISDYNKGFLTYENIENIRVKFYSTDTAWFYVDITPQAGLGYKISPDISVGTLFNQSGGSTTVDPSQISKIGIEITPTSGDTTKVGMDGLRVNDEDTFDPTFGIISRTTLATPLEKIAGRSVDVEYRLDLGF
jgi:hypothetical protein